MKQKERNETTLGRANELERVKGIEPSQPAWKAGALPLSYTRERATAPISDQPDGLGTDERDPICQLRERIPLPH